MVDDVVIIRNEEIRLAHRQHNTAVIKCLDPKAPKQLLIKIICNKLFTSIGKRISAGFGLVSASITHCAVRKKYFYVVVVFFFDTPTCFIHRNEVNACKMRTHKNIAHSDRKNEIV